ncbi:metallophosphoesterase family protein [Actinoplanes sp. G11-F43]|uniref:metallophosphoesterase family protein n=1 Tax=Actinoplanes sp. G11-F43 TaxID=3424130 RepID=UPI003D357C4C
MSGTLFAISDLHVVYAENRRIVQDMRPHDDGDWLIVAGDVGEMFADIEWALGLLSSRFAKVIWAPGNHELWTPRDDPAAQRGVARYEKLVDMCRGLGVSTPEDDYPVWTGAGGPVRVAPLFVGYDYSFRAPGTSTKEESLAYAHRTGIVCTDEVMLFPDPYPDRETWCAARVTYTEARLAACAPDVPLVLVNHYPLVREPTRVLWHPEFAQWCGTERTADWHTRFPVSTVIYGHLHIPRTTWYDGVRFEEVSVGYPREWRTRSSEPGRLRPVLLAGAADAATR